MRQILMQHNTGIQLLSTVYYPTLQFKIWSHFFCFQNALQSLKENTF